MIYAKMNNNIQYTHQLNNIDSKKHIQKYKHINSIQKTENILASRLISHPY